MSQTYYAILTAIGEAKLANAAALNTTLKIAKMAVGDGGGVVPTPNRSQTALVGEWYRAGLNTLAVDPSNTSQIIAELVIPEATGGNWIREMGLIDADGNLIAVANTPPSYKPQLAEGSGRTQVLRMVLIVSSASAVELKIDPSVVLATRQYVDDAITVAVNRLDNKQSVRVASTANLALSGTPTVDGIALAVGDRVLVKNQDTASQNGLYLVAAGTWNRALDADASSEVTPGLTVYVEQGNTQADTAWSLLSDGPITLGTTALPFGPFYNTPKLLALLQSGAPTFGTAFGGANSYAVTYAPAIPVPVDGMVLKFVAATANTGPSRFTLAGLGWAPLRAISGEELQGGEILVSSLCTVIYSSGAEAWFLLSATRGAAPVAAGSQSRHAARLADCAAVPAGLKNKLINASGVINQRGYASGTASKVAKQYTLDRWRIVVLGEALTYAAAGNAVQMTAPNGGIEQVIEESFMEGGNYRLSWVGTAVATVNGVEVANGGSISINSGVRTNVRFAKGSVLRPQLALEALPSSFETRPIALELMLCQRYFEKSYDLNVAPGTASAEGCVISYAMNGATVAAPIVSYKVPKRAVPTLTFYSLSGAAGKTTLDSSSDIAGPSGSAYARGLSGFEMFWSSNSLTTNRNIYQHYTADAEIGD